MKPENLSPQNPTSETYLYAVESNAQAVRVVGSRGD